MAITSSLIMYMMAWKSWFEKAIANANPGILDLNWVLTDTFFAGRVSDNKIAGIVNLRYQLNR